EHARNCGVVLDIDVDPSVTAEDAVREGPRVAVRRLGCERALCERCYVAGLSLGDRRRRGGGVALVMDAEVRRVELKRKSVVAREGGEGRAGERGEGGGGGCEQPE